MRITRRIERDERGSLIVAVMVMMVLVLLSSVVVARTLAGLKSTKQSQDFSGALAQADGGLSDALFRIDQLGTNPAATFCVGGNAACTLASVPAAPGVQYTARRVDDNTYTILSKGLVNGQPARDPGDGDAYCFVPVRPVRQELDHVQRQHRRLRPRAPGRARSRRWTPPTPSCSPRRRASRYRAAGRSTARAAARRRPRTTTGARA